MSYLTKILEKKITRRSFLKNSALGAAAIGSFSFLSACKDAKPMSAAIDKDLRVLGGYKAQTIISWGDDLFARPSGKSYPGYNKFDPLNFDTARQKEAFGYNNDYLAFMPISGASDHGLLCINHEYTNAALMFADGSRTKARAELELAANGQSVVELKKDEAGVWRKVMGRYNRRLNGLDTKYEITGPARGSDRMRTSYDPAGEFVYGSFANCAGGKTPWNTVLSAEENFNGYFLHNTAENAGREFAQYDALSIKDTDTWYDFGKFVDRLDIAKEPNEPNRYGWVVEYDPYDAISNPKKRTALGRFKHECANTAVSHDGRVAVYMGDDERFECLYKFVTNKTSGTDMLDDGVLYVAKFNEDMSLVWMPLVYGENGLDESNGFESQADVMIETRRAAKLLGATEMDRPEDVEPHPVTGKVYVALTNNHKRLKTNAANPRPANIYGHIIEISAPMVDGKPDHTSKHAKWDFALMGDADICCPDNLAINPVSGELMIATDGMEKVASKADGIFFYNNGAPKRLISAPAGSEVCGPEFTPDGKTLFACIQHPGERSSFDNPSTRWPDFDTGLPPRPSVVAIEQA